MPLRFGVMVNSTTLRRWQWDVVSQLLEIDGVSVSLLTVDARSRPARNASQRVQSILRSPRGLWDLYNNGWVGRRARSLRPVDCSQLLGGLPRIDVTVEKRGYSEYFPDDAVAQIRDHDLDVLLRFAFGIIRGPILEAARYGVWSFHHDDEQLYRGSPPAFWEIVDDQPVSGAILQRLTDRLDGGVVLERGWFPTARHSYVKNTDTVHLGAADWPARAARLLLETHEPGGEPSTSQAPIRKVPDNPTTARFLGRQVARFATEQIAGVTRADQWEIGLARAPIERFLDPSFRPKVEWLDAGTPREAYAADPFGFTVEGRDHVLYERFDSQRRLGQIWELELTDPLAPPRPSGLPVTVHASYPYCFDHAGTTWCLPQVSEPGVPLFERLGTGQWTERARLLPHTTLLDPTVVHHGDRFWLFGTRPGADSLTKLHAYWAHDLLGPWVPHVGNPVKTDVRSARPAGTPFVHNGSLIRPAQDCSRGYGTAVSLCEVTALTPTTFEERVVRVIEPDPSWPFPAGLHTLARLGSNTLIDARRSIFDPRESLSEIRGRARKLARR